ncbi:hypothetical protein L207DRAFT_521269 [Hyaloscypha variabilis F]|uniref:Uncharacterized protein n=1 Tax=Hyaloscypha variabilis (strain UAMH 11265 / GT02V1 / F) TaxID=1149755 RepID=A0A2J6QRQ2_HYAVF|nr:hypothetical protein L207DRAFT_521269 [Hyaloscypha variabilis F]
MGDWDTRFWSRRRGHRRWFDARLFVILSQPPLHLFLAFRAAPDKLVHPLEGVVGSNQSVFIPLLHIQLIYSR